MCKYYPFLLLFFVALSLHGQSYDFSVSRQPYQALTGGTSVNDGVIWDSPVLPVSLGFEFELFGDPASQLFVAGGGAEIRSSMNYFFPTNVIAVNLNDLVDRNSQQGNASLSPITYSLLGETPNRVGILQWENVGYYHDFWDLGYYARFNNFQLWLYEGSNVIEVHYGPNNVSSIESYYEDYPGVYLSKHSYYDTRFSDIIFDELFHLSGEAAAPSWVRAMNMSESYERSFYLDSAPTEGTVYTFRPAGSVPTQDRQPGCTQVEVYPNPARSTFRLTLPQEAGAIDRVALYDLTGKLVRSFGNDPVNYTLDGLPDGMYQLQLTTDSGKVASRLLARQ